MGQAILCFLRSRLLAFEHQSLDEEKRQGEGGGNALKHQCASSWQKFFWGGEQKMQKHSRIPSSPPLCETASLFVAIAAGSNFALNAVKLAEPSVNTKDADPRQVGMW